MSIFALQSIAGGFLDEDLNSFNKNFDDWCVQFESYDDAMIILQTLENEKSIVVVEITPLSYPKYFFSSLQGTIYLTRQIKDKIILHKAMFASMVDKSYPSAQTPPVVALE